MVKHRRQKATDLLQQHQLDALLVTDMMNIRYLTGFTGSEGLLLISADNAWFLCDSRYTTQAEKQVQCEVVEFKSRYIALVDLLRQQKLKRVGFDSAHVTFADYQELQTHAAADLEWLAVKDTSLLRLIKDDAEIALLEQATLLSAQAFDDVLSNIVPGVAEGDVSLALEMAIRKRGGEEKSFDFIVASGERGAMPHGVASTKLIESDELITIDFGGRYRGYYADETVTCAMGQPNDRLCKIFDIVLEAHDRAIAAVKPGVLLKDIDAVARDYITQAGYGEYFGHGLGHGVGLEVHEAPRVSPLSKGLTEAGMVFTVEPGIYLPGLGGVRIEDMVVVTEDGCRVLTRLPKQFHRLN